jgi:hypothetical protein
VIKEKPNHIETGRKIENSKLKSVACSVCIFSEHKDTKAQSRYREANIAVGKYRHRQISQQAKYREANNAAGK